MIHVLQTIGLIYFVGMSIVFMIAVSSDLLDSFEQFVAAVLLWPIFLAKLVYRGTISLWKDI